MKVKQGLASVLSLSLFFLPQTLRSQIAVTFDMSMLGNSGLDPSNVFVTFAAKDASLSLGSSSILFSGGATSISGTSYGTSAAYSLQDIATNGLTLNSSTSLIGFISYGSSAGIAMLGSGVQPNPQDSTVARYSQFEISYADVAGVQSGGADLTNISQFGGSLGMAFKAGSTTQSYVQNTLNTGDTFRALAATSGYSPYTVITSGGNFVRAVGPNTFPSSISGSFVQNPYPKLNNSLQSLFTTYKTAPDSSTTNNVTPGGLTNLAPGAAPGGTGSVGETSLSTADSARVAPSTGYNLDYHFQSVLTQATTPSGPSDPNGTYSVTLSGYVNATPSTGGTTYKYDNLSITVPADDLANVNYYMTNFLYTEATTGQGISVNFSGWDNLITDFGSATVSGALQEKAAGDFAQGMLTGFVGSTTPGYVDGSGTTGGALGTMSSYQWWEYNAALAYGPAQPDNPFYSAWGNVISENSDGMNGVPFPRGGVYGSPYDDRFALNLIAPTNDTTELAITLLPDGVLAVPEPSVCALLAMGVSLVFVARFRSRAGRAEAATGKA